MFRSILTLVAALAPPLAAAQDRGAWSAGDAAAPTVRGTFIERGGGFTFVPDTAPGDAATLPPVSVANPEAISDLATDIELDVDLDFDPQSGQVRIAGYEIAKPSVDMSSGLSGDADTPLANFRSAIDRALQPGDMAAEITASSTDSSIRSVQQSSEQALSRIYRDAVDSGDTEARTTAVREKAEIRRVSKAIFGPTINNYDPWTYDRIYRRSRSVVAIADGSTRRAICSGFLIGPDLVMTAGHCFKAGDLRDIEIWFGFEETENAVTSAPRRFAATELVVPGASAHADFFERAASDTFERDFLDLAVLRFSPDNCLGDGVCEPLLPEVASACLRVRPIRRDQPLYLIGYPKGNRAKVHDNARMYLPHRVNRFVLATIKEEIEVDFASLEATDRIALMEELTASYQEDGSEFLLHDRTFGGQPKFGLIADTFKGNSGSPVFYRNDHCVAGMLIGGVSDTGERLLPSWINHETAVPMGAIIEAIGADPDTAPLLDSFRVD